MMCIVTEGDDEGLSLSTLGAQFIIDGLAIKAENLQHYFMWLFPFLALSWKVTPSGLDSTAKAVVDFIDRQDKKVVGYALSVLSKFPSNEFWARLLWSYDKENPCNIPDSTEVTSSQPSNSYILFKIEDDMLNSILSNDIAVQDDALARIFEQPEANGTPMVDLLVEAQKRGRHVPPDFLTSLYWYVPDMLKPRVKSLYSMSLYMQMNKETIVRDAL